MPSACALGIFSGKIIFNFAFVALCGALQTHFHGRGRNGQRHLLRRFLRKRGAAGVPAPPGGAVAQRLRGFKSAEPEKTVKRSSRRTGVNLQFFPVQPTPLGLKGASSPFFVAPARRNRWHFSGSLLVSKENIPRRAPTIPKSAPHFRWKCGALWLLYRLMPPAGAVPQRTGRQ